MGNVGCFGTHKQSPPLRRALAVDLVTAMPLRKLPKPRISIFCRQQYVVLNVKPTIVVKAADGDELLEGRQAGETDRSPVISITSPHYDSHRLAALRFR